MKFLFHGVKLLDIILKFIGNETEVLALTGIATVHFF